MSEPLVRTLAVAVDGRSVPVRLRRNRRAKRLVMRLDNDGDGVVVTLPRFATQAEAIDLVRARSRWIFAHLEKLPPRRPFADGMVLPLIGVDHRVRHRPEARRGTWCAAGEINVSGPAEHLPRRLTDWLKGEARNVLTPRARDAAGRLGRPLGRVSVRDTRSRWGSCSAGGNLSFSWRLILAPEHVLDYVVAHEAAHLVHMNHGARFWGTVASLGVDVAGGRAWLRRNGEALLRYG